MSVFFFVLTKICQFNLMFVLIAPRPRQPTPSLASTINYQKVNGHNDLRRSLHGHVKTSRPVPLSGHRGGRTPVVAPPTAEGGAMPHVEPPKKSGRVQGDAGRSGGAGANRATARRRTTAPYGAPLAMGRREGTGGVRDTGGLREQNLQLQQICFSL